jgi:hypothetical protein
MRQQQRNSVRAAARAEEKERWVVVEAKNTSPGCSRLQTRLSSSWYLFFGVFFFQVPGTLCRREREKASRATLVEVCRHAEWVFGLWKKHETRNITVTDERIWHRGVDGQLAKSIF